MDCDLNRILRFVLLPSVGVLSACAAPAPRPLPAPRARSWSEEELKPMERVSLAITGHDEIPSPDGKTVTVTGTVANWGTKPTHQVSVRVEALGRDGAVLLSA